MSNSINYPILDNIEKLVIEKSKKQSHFVSKVNEIYENIIKNIISNYFYDEKIFYEFVDKVITNSWIDIKDYDKIYNIIFKRFAIEYILNEKDIDVYDSYQLLYISLSFNIEYNEWDSTHCYPKPKIILDDQKFINEFNIQYEQVFGSSLVINDILNTIEYASKSSNKQIICFDKVMKDNINDFCEYINKLYDIHNFIQNQVDELNDTIFNVR